MNSTTMSKSLLFIIILLISSLAGITSDIYAPSLPAISKSLNTSINLVQWSMAIYMLGLAISQVVYGPLSEGFGRRPILIIGLIILIVGSGICYFSQNI
ncbi:MAG: Inner membrane transport protein YdhC, partial [Candidatus Anoxychlamydiales bacterium]|nr:Inner membrane transport protein YdhC [Candidatus Anoxychlamydiales bacterium]